MMLAALTNHLWQSTMCAAAAALLAWLLRDNRAHVRYWLWLSASLKFLVPFSLLVSLGHAFPAVPEVRQFPAPPPSVVSFVVEPFAAPVAGLAQSGPAVWRMSPVWLQAFVAVTWASGFVLLALMRLRSWLRIRAACRASDSATIAIPDQGIDVRSSPGLFEPGVVGVWRPILLLPADIDEHLTPRQLAAVIAHEFCHVRRRDNLTAAAHMLVEAIWWFHPLVWWIGTRLVNERERACDEAVLSLGAEPREYAQGILNVCKRYHESPLACVAGVGVGGGSNVAARLEAIVSHRIGGPLNAARKAILVLAATTALVAPMAAGALTPSVAAVTPARHSVSRQAGSSPRRFEVASIRPCESRGLPPGARGGGPGPAISPGRLNLNCQIVQGLIQAAYVMFPNGARATPGAVFRTPIEGGPDWIASERYTIEAKATGTPSRELMQGPMLQTLLEDRFKLKIHRETREVPAYALTVAKSGKLKPFQEGSCVPPVRMVPPGPQPELAPGERRCARLVTMEGPNRAFNVEGVTVAEFVDSYLSGPFTPFTGIAHVVDRTGLSGKFDFHVVSAPPPGDPGVQNLIDRGVNPGEPTAPELPAALQEQLGLKLQSTKVPGEFVVIDHIERPVPDGPMVTPAAPSRSGAARGPR